MNVLYFFIIAHGKGGGLDSMRRILRILNASLLCFLFVNETALALDPPHNSSDASRPVYCLSCHILHDYLGDPGLGASLTKETNANLCLSCHISGGLAGNKPFSAGMQATAGSSGTSHSWEGTMPATDDPDNPYGLRSTASLANSDLKAQLQKFNDTVVCSVCHNQHLQTGTPWDPSSPAYSGSGTGTGRHLQRLDNDHNEMCEDCHYYRSRQYTDTENVRTYTGNKKSHPLGKVFSSSNGETRTVTNTNQFNNAPLKPQSAGWVPQSGIRYQTITGTDTNPTNNLVLDSNFQIGCLTCHGIHYTDSDSSTIDQP